MGKVLVSPEWKCGLTIDVVIACVHAIDPGLLWNKGTGRRTCLMIRVTLLMLHLAIVRISVCFAIWR